MKLFILYRFFLYNSYRSIQKLLPAIAMLLPVILSAVFAQNSMAENSLRPNVIFILADDLGGMDIGAFNRETFYETPHIDRLAAGGMTFTSAYSACNVCSPTRYSIMAGRYPARSGVTNFLAGERSARFNPAPLDLFMSLEEETLGEAFHDAGYKTAYVGKWHLGNLTDYGPDKQGFDVVAGDMRYTAPDITGVQFSERKPIRVDELFIEKKTDEITHDALAILDAWKEESFLLYFSMYQVHVPLGASPEVVARYEEKRKELGLDSETLSDFIAEEQCLDTDEERLTRIVQNHAVYAGMIDHTDRCVGALLDKLDELGIADNTIIVFTSDNGGLSTAEGSPTSNLPYRTGKGWMYEGGIRVPMIIRWSQKIAPGSCDEPIISTDYYPTLLELAGIVLRPNQHLDGVSFVPLLEGTTTLEREALFWHYPHYSNQGGFPASAIRMGDYKLIQRLEDGVTQLYNLRSDIGEKNDLTTTEPARVKTMQQRLFDWYKETGARFLREKNDLSPWKP